MSAQPRWVCPTVQLRVFWPWPKPSEWRCSFVWLKRFDKMVLFSVVVDVCDVCIQFMFSRWNWISNQRKSKTKTVYYFGDKFWSCHFFFCSNYFYTNKLWYDSGGVQLVSRDFCVSRELQKPFSEKPKWENESWAESERSWIVIKSNSSDASSVVIRQSKAFQISQQD